jgi:hypothetical protein
MRFFTATLILALALTASPLAAQMDQTTPGGLRAYWHVFVAYALVWVLVAGWMVAIARRLTRVSKHIEE